MDILKFINENMLILVAVLYVLGTVIKKTPNIKDWLLLWILLPLGIFLAVLYKGFALEAGFTPPIVTDAVVQGILVTGAAVLVNELPKQLKKGMHSKEKEEDEQK